MPATMSGPEQLGPSRGQHHERPAGLTIADHAWLAVGFGMQGDHFFQKDGLGLDDVLDGLARHGLWQKADEIAGVAGFERHADLAVGLEAADPGSVPGARIDHDEPPDGIEDDPIRRQDTGENIVDGPSSVRPSMTTSPL